MVVPLIVEQHLTVYRTLKTLQTDLTISPENAPSFQELQTVLRTSESASCQVLQEFTELFNGESSIADYATHRVGIDWIIARNGKEANTVRHYNVLTLTNNPET